LLSKEVTNLGKNFFRHGAPKEAVKACVSKIETDFGKVLTKNSVYFDKNDKLIGLIIEKREGKKLLSKKEFIFSGDNDTVRQIASTVKVDGVLKQRTFSRQVPNLEKTGFYREKVIIEPNTQGYQHETQFFEQLKPNNKRKFIKTETMRSPQGELSNSTISGNACSENELKELSKYPYVFEKAHSNKDFLTNIFNYATKKQDVRDRNISFAIKKLKGNILGLSYNHRRFIEIDLDACENKKEIVDTLHHELRHQYQDKIIKKYTHGKVKTFFSELLYPFKKRTSVKALKSEKDFANKCLKDYKHYVSSEKNFEKYYDQFVEVDARKAGETAEKEYNKLSDSLKKIFPEAMRADWSVGQFNFWNAVEEAPVVKIPLKLFSD
jgi:hypothetical protein